VNKILATKVVPFGKKLGEGGMGVVYNARDAELIVGRHNFNIDLYFLNSRNLINFENELKEYYQRMNK
jgi:chromosome condensin MukBEF MukE localization factor